MDQAILDRIKKLLSLAEGNDSINESASAFKQAQKLMEKHRISASMLNSQSTDDEFVQDILFHAGKRIIRWKEHVAVSLAEVNGCYTFTSRIERGKNKGVVNVMLVGAPDDIEVVREMYSAITKEIERLCSIHADQVKAQDLGRKSLGKRWFNSFRIGAAAVVAERLRDAYTEAHGEMRTEAAASSDSTALARVSDAIERSLNKVQMAKKWAFGTQDIKTRATTTAYVNTEAHEAGKRAGQTIDISKNPTTKLQLRDNYRRLFGKRR